jgi:hypothetical protein
MQDDTPPFSLAFRTLTLPDMGERLTHAGFEHVTPLGDCQGGSWDLCSAVWILAARRR